MLGENLNGLLLPAAPDCQGGAYQFRVLERYYGRGKGGGDLCVTYPFWVKAGDLHFDASDFGGRAGVVLGVRPSAFDRLEAAARERRPNDIAVYPVFAQ